MIIEIVPIEGPTRRSMGPRVVARQYVEEPHPTIPDHDNLKDNLPTRCRECKEPMLAVPGVFHCSDECSEGHWVREWEREEAAKKAAAKAYNARWMRKHRDHRDHTQACSHCSAEFTTKRSDARYCSGKCRTAANRLRTAAKAARARLLANRS